MESTEKRLRELSGAKVVAKSRPVFAVPLEGKRGEVGKWVRVAGRASSAAEAMKRVREAGYSVVRRGGNIEVSPGEVAGTDEDVWTVTVRG